MSGKQILAEMLIAEGATEIFGNPGTSESPFMDVLQDYPQVKYYVALQEATAVGMAEGYARANGRPAFANLHIAGGLANGISMLYNCYKGGTPLVLTAGNADTRMSLTRPGAVGGPGRDDTPVHQVEHRGPTCGRHSGGDATGLQGGQDAAHRPYLHQLPLGLHG